MARLISGAVHDPNYVIASPSTAKGGIKLTCRDCGKRFVHGVTGEARESGARCQKCLRAIFGTGYTMGTFNRNRTVEQQRHEQRVRRYGLTTDGHATLVRSQQGSCAICGFTPRDGRELVIDHNHGTDEVRGLLCGKCNTALGMFGDDPERIEAAAEYLRAKGSTPVPR